MVVNGPSKVTPFSRPAESHDLQVELSAMHAMADALAQLPDDETRARVLRWAMSRFCPTVPVVPFDARPATSAPAGAPQLPSNLTPAPDDDLSVSALEELFGAQPLSREECQPGNGILREFVTDFQDIVHEWNAACSEPAVTPSIET